MINLINFFFNMICSKHSQNWKQRTVTPSCFPNLADLLTSLNKLVWIKFFLYIYAFEWISSIFDLRYLFLSCLIITKISQLNDYAGCWAAEQEIPAVSPRHQEENRGSHRAGVHEEIRPRQKTVHLPCLIYIR